MLIDKVGFKNHVVEMNSGSRDLQQIDGALALLKKLRFDRSFFFCFYPILLMCICDILSVYGYF